MARTARIETAMDAFMSIDARAVQPSVLFVDRHTIDLADVPDRVEVAEQQDLARSTGELGPDVIAAKRLRKPRHRRSSVGQHGGERGATAINGGLVGARGLELDQSVDRSL